MINNLLLIAGMAALGYVLTSILHIKESFGPVLSIAVSMAILEIGGAFGILWQTASFYCVAVCVLVIIYTVYSARTDGKENIKSYFLNPYIIGFLFATLFYLILSRGKTIFYTRWDSFLHWGMFSKNVFYNHNFDVWNHDVSVNHRVYPHGMAAWYALFALGKRIYAERDIMLSINVLLFASSCPIVDAAVSRIRKSFADKKIVLALMYPAAGVSVASLLWIWRFREKIWPYISGYMDIPLGAAFIVALCLAVTESADYYRKAFGVSLLSAMLVMIKPSGIVFVGAVCLVYLLSEYAGKESRMTAAAWKRLFFGGALSVSIPLLELGIWNGMMKYLGATGSDQFRLQDFLPGNVIMRYQTNTELLRTIVCNFLKAHFTRGVALHISAFGWMALCLAIAVFTIAFLKDRREKKKVLYVNIGMLCVFFLYNVFLLWTYLTTMSDGEALGVNCYDRYIGSYIMGWFSLCIYFLFVYHAGALKIQYLYFGLFFVGNICGFLNKNTYLKEIPDDLMEVYELSNSIRNDVPEINKDDFEGMPDLWVSYADDEECLNDGQLLQLRYYLFPDFDLVDAYEMQDDYRREMRDIVAEHSFDYVVLYGVNEEFYNSYYWFFSDGLSNAKEQYQNGHYQAYKVIRDENTGEFCWFEPIL